MYNFKEIWWHRPELRKEGEDDTDRKTTWLDLFYDLFFVAVIAVLTSHLSEDFDKNHSWYSITSFILFFVPIWWVWAGNTFYNERFATDDISHRLFSFFQMLPVAALAYFAGGGHENEFAVNGFAVSFVTARIMLLYLWNRATIFNPNVKPVVKTFNIFFGASIVLFAISIYIPTPYKFGVWSVALIVDLIGPFFSVKSNRKLPKIHREHITERFGLFTLIVLGESIAAVLNGISDIEITGQNTLIALLGLAITFGFWFLYFDQIIPGNRKEKVVTRFLWVYGHLPLLLGLAAFSSALLAIVGSSSLIICNEMRWLTFGSVGTIFLSLAIIEIAFKGYYGGLKLPILFKVGRYGSILICLLLAIYGIELNAIWILVIILFLIALQTFLGVYLWTKVSKE